MRQDRNGVRSAADLERKYDFSGMQKAYRLNKTGLNKVNAEMENFVRKVLGTMGTLQEQKDGRVDTYYYSGVPSLSNVPASGWTTEQYEEKDGDLYYDAATGNTYRFTYTNGAAEWVLTDNEASAALSIANASGDTVDNKRSVFLDQPVPPYSNGDLWVKDGQLYVCQVSKDSGTFEEKDFIAYGLYTEGTSAEQLGDQLKVVYGTVLTVKESVDEYKVKVEANTTLVNTLGDTVAQLDKSYGELSVKAGEIEASVSSLSASTAASLALKVGIDEYDRVVSMINASANLIDLKADRFKLTTPNMTIDEQGNLWAQNGSFTGTVNAGDGKIGPFTISSDGLNGYLQNNDHDYAVTRTVFRAVTYASNTPAAHSARTAELALDGLKGTAVLQSKENVHIATDALFRITDFGISTPRFDVNSDGTIKAYGRANLAAGCDVTAGFTLINGQMTLPGGNQWHRLGNGCWFGDSNWNGAFAIRGINDNTQIRMFDLGGTRVGVILWDGEKFTFSHPISAPQS